MYIIFPPAVVSFIRNILFKKQPYKRKENEKNNRKNKLKAVVAVVLVIASMFAMSSLVNAGIMELILGEKYAEVAAAT